MALTFSLGFNGWEGNVLLIYTCKLFISSANCPTWFSKFYILDLFSFRKSKELEARDFTISSKVMPLDWFCVGFHGL